MRLWLVIYILGKITAVMGPLPADEAACKQLAQNYVVTIEPDPATSDAAFGTADVRVECEWSTTRPEGGEPLEQLDD